jgi:hypothetical protein
MVKKKYRVEISNRFTALENLDEMDINSGWRKYHDLGQRKSRISEAKA